MNSTEDNVKNTKTEQVGMRLSPEAKRLLKAAAARDHRSISNMIEHLIFEHCDKQQITLDEVPEEKRGDSEE